MVWFYLSIIAYLLLAFESVANKILISGKVKSWRLYLFYMGVLSFFSIGFAPFGLAWSGWSIFFSSVLAGAVFFAYLAFLFYSLKGSAATRVFVLIGAVSTMFTLIFSHFFLDDNFSKKELLGILVLLFGGFMISFKFYKGRFFSAWKQVFIAGFLYASSLVLLKYTYSVYDNLYDGFASFVNGYVYSRLGIVFMAFLAFLFPSFRDEILKSFNKKNKKKHVSNFSAVFLIKALAGLATFILQYAISIGNVTIISALESVKYLFIFFLSIFVARYFSNLARENVRLSTIITKAFGVFLVILGVILVTV